MEGDTSGIFATPQLRQGPTSRLLKRRSQAAAVAAASYQPSPRPHATPQQRSVADSILAGPNFDQTVDTTVGGGRGYQVCPLTQILGFAFCKKTPLILLGGQTDNLSSRQTFCATSVTFTCK